MPIRIRLRRMMIKKIKRGSLVIRPGAQSEEDKDLEMHLLADLTDQEMELTNLKISLIMNKLTSCFNMMRLTHFAIKLLSKR